MTARTDQLTDEQLAGIRFRVTKWAAGFKG